MSETPEQFVKRCREYESKATPADWCIDSRNHPDNAELLQELYVYEDVDADGTRICTMSFAQGSDAFENANFIVSARADLPAACDIIEALVQEKEHQSTMIRDLCLRGDEYHKHIEQLVQERDALTERVKELQEWALATWSRSEEMSETCNMCNGFGYVGDQAGNEFTCNYCLGRGTPKAGIKIKFGGCWIGIVTYKCQNRKWIMFAPIPFLVITWEIAP